MFSSKKQFTIATLLFVVFLSLLFAGLPTWAWATALSLSVAFLTTALLQNQHEAHMASLREYERTLHRQPQIVAHNLSYPETDQPQPDASMFTDFTNDADDDNFALDVDGPGFEDPDHEGPGEDPDGYMAEEVPQPQRRYITANPDDTSAPEIDPSTAAGPFAHGTVTRNPATGTTTTWDSAKD
jgi:hypothetical protein